MSNQIKNVSAMNNSNCIGTPCSAKTAHTSLLEILPKVEHIGMEVENKICNLSKTKRYLFSDLTEFVDKLPDDNLKNNLFDIVWQIQTLDDCISECMKAEDFYNLDNFIYYAKKILTQKSA